MSEFSIEPDAVRSGAEKLFAASGVLYTAVTTMADESGKLEGTAEARGFVGIAECVAAAELWNTDYIAVHRADIEDLAMNVAVCAASSSEVDTYVSSMFDASFVESYFPEGRATPAPVRPDPDPSSQMPRGSESVAV